jgi:serine/threonine protein phosphatase PrpC
MFKVSKIIQGGGHELQDRAEFFWCNSNLILVVADGAGGRSGGAEAAEFFVKNIKERIYSLDLSSKALCHLVGTIDREMAASGKFGETTCVVASLSSSGIMGTSVGDSGALIFSKGGIHNLTEDQIRKPFVGTGGAVPIGFNSSSFEGTLVIASDGLLKYTSQEKIAETVAAADFDSLAEKLMALVRYQSGALPDDVSILVARSS